MFTFFILSLVCWRITYMLVNELGPWSVFLRLRKFMDGKPFSPLDCFYCTSIWVAFPLSLSIWESGIYYWFALSAAAIMIDKVHEFLMIVTESDRGL